MCSISFTYAFIWYQSTTALDEVVYLSMLVTSLSFVFTFILKIFLPCFFWLVHLLSQKSLFVNFTSVSIFCFTKHVYS